jgi:hypothetical protein
VPPKIKIVVGAVVALLFAGAMIYVFNFGPPPPLSLPNPNGYEDFIAAARSAGKPLIFETNAPTADLAADVAANRRALDLARAGLAKKCQAFELDESVGTNWMQVLAGFKSVCGLFTEEARVAGETNAAAGMAGCLEAVRFAREIARRGPLINHLVGIACQQIALKEAARNVSRMSPAEGAEAARRFRQIERDAATWDEVLAGERTYFNRHAGFGDKLARFIMRTFLGASINQARAKLDTSAARLKAFIATLDACAKDDRDHTPAEETKKSP